MSLGYESLLFADQFSFFDITSKWPKTTQIVAILSSEERGSAELTKVSSGRYCLSKFLFVFGWGFAVAGQIAMLMPSRVAGRTLGLLRPGLALGSDCPPLL